MRNVLLFSLQLPMVAFSQNLMPMPSSVKLEDGYATVDSSFSLQLDGKRNSRIAAIAERFLSRFSRQIGVPISLKAQERNERATLTITWLHPFRQVPSLEQDESYSLHADSDGVRIKAQEFAGALRGIETFLQLVEVGAKGFRIPYVEINDSPRFTWRGLLIDACRHWMPVEVIKRNLDGMAMVKLNVLHWHLSEDQGFRVESKKFPKLHELGSDGNYYTQQQIREVIAYAANRGIRVVPEFDMPGHATAWFVGYPELSGGPGPYQIQRTWGIFDPAMDPSRESTYKFLDRFIGEMARLFPDEYFHIGGDEVKGSQWDENPKIQSFKQKKGFKDNHALQAYFNRRILAILKKHGKKMIGWDEIFHPDLPNDIVVQSWRGQKSLAEGAKQGYQGILSSGYYLDHMLPASAHYRIDPIDSTIAKLPPDQQKQILGGEACMWSEYVSPENIDSRIWPRTAAIAERFWSPAAVNDAADMYRRLEVASMQLEMLGLTHRSSYETMLERIAGPVMRKDLQALADVVEPVKVYQRGRTRPHTSLTPLNRLVDAVRPESHVARRFAALTDDFLANDLSENGLSEFKGYLVLWKENDSRLQPLFTDNILLEGVEQLSKDLSDVAGIGLQLIKRKGFSAEEKQQFNTIIENAGKQKAALLLMVVPSIKKLMSAAP